MEKNISGMPVDIEPIRQKIISVIEKERERGCRLAAVGEAASEFESAVRGVIAAGKKHLASESSERVGTALALLEHAYMEWKTVDHCFSETLRMAFNGFIPRSNLFLDDIHARLKNSVGDPLATLYTRTCSIWGTHLEKRPWDAFVIAGAEHADREEFKKSLNALSHGDDLDVEDAIEDLTASLRSLFVCAIEDGKMLSNIFTSSLWKRPEIIVINDYWRGKTDARILSMLTTRGASNFTGKFAKVQALFENNGTGASFHNTSFSDRIMQSLNDSEPAERDKYLRCLMLHPNNTVRRFAAANIDFSNFWKTVTPRAIPCCTILSQLEQVVGSSRFDENLKKVFFNAVYKRLLTLTSRSEVIYALGISRIFMQLDFLLEDYYFEKLIILLNYLEAKRRFYKIKNSIFDEFVAKFKADKRKLGPKGSEPHDFQAIPPVVLRKLARDGHFWYELSMHPIYKVSRETIPHINSVDRAYRIAVNQNVNQDVLREVG
ncbi:MAG: hypothetical protein ABIA59_05970, partial [Candidatus Latescibacterota bacterium]